MARSPSDRASAAIAVAGNDDDAEDVVGDVAPLVLVPPRGGGSVVSYE